jgi:hypothetical protein
MNKYSGVNDNTAFFSSILVAIDFGNSILKISSTV